MAKKTKNKTSVGKINLQSNYNILSQLKLGESYVSLFLGAVVVIVVLILIFSFLKARNLNRGQIGTSTSTTSKVQMINGRLAPRSYVVRSGDDLWHLAEKIYGSGYNWVDLASANKLENPEVLLTGTTIFIPNVAAKTITAQPNQGAQQNSITGVSYTIQKGDFLWDIAVRAYGDGYKWVEIAKANNLTNPDIINVDNTLKIPR